jgi:hypothetical protein
VPAQFRRAERTVWRHMHGTVLILPVSDRDVVALNGAAAELWRLLAEPLTVDQAARRLADIYDVAPDVVARDIAPVLDDLATRRVLTRVDAA